MRKMSKSRPMRGYRFSAVSPISRWVAAIRWSLHLAGWHDHDPAEAHAKAETQQRIRQQCLLGMER